MGKDTQGGALRVDEDAELTARSYGSRTRDTSHTDIHNSDVDDADSTWLPSSELRIEHGSPTPEEAAAAIAAVFVKTDAARIETL